MKKSKVSEPGLDYCRKMGIRAQKSLSNIYSDIERKCGRAVADRFRATKTDPGKRDQNFYSLQNEDYEASLIFSGGVDGNIIRAFANYLAAHEDAFGPRVLEVGCNNGLLSCFIAQQFPASQIVGIDLCEEAVTNARTLAANLGLDNIEFRCCDVADEALGSFDTVFSGRTLSENSLEISPGFEGFDPDVLVHKLFPAQAEFCRPSVADYAGVLAARVAPGGALVSIEKYEQVGPLIFAWAEELAAKGCVYEAGSMKRIDADELDNHSHYTAIVTRAGDPVDDATVIFTAIEEDALREIYKYQPEPGLLLVEQAAEMIDGVFICQGERAIGRRIVWSRKEGTGEGFFLDQAMRSDAALEIVTLDNLRELAEGDRAKDWEYGPYRLRAVVRDGWNLREGDVLAGPQIWAGLAERFGI